MIVGCYELHLYCEAMGPVESGDPKTNGKCWRKQDFSGESKREAESQARGRGWDLTLEYCPKHAAELHEKRARWSADASAHYEAFKKGGPSLAESGWVDVNPRTGEPLTKDAREDGKKEKQEHCEHVWTTTLLLKHQPSQEGCKKCGIPRTGEPLTREKK